MNRWDRRIERAAELARKYPSAGEMLRLYRELAVFQSNPRIGPPVLDNLPALLDLVRRKGTAVLRDRADYLAAHSDKWRVIFGGHGDPAYAFFVRVLEQAHYELRAF